MTETSKLSHDAASASSRNDGSAAPKPANTMFVGLTLSMAWQLAIVVLVGVFGGHELDLHLKSTPLWTVIGLVLGMIGMIIIVRRTLSQLNDYIKTMPKEQK